MYTANTKTENTRSEGKIWEIKVLKVTSVSNKLFFSGFFCNHKMKCERQKFCIGKSKKKKRSRKQNIKSKQFKVHNQGIDIG